MSKSEFDSTMASFYVADWEIRPGASEVAHSETVVKLEPRVMDLLQVLASKPGEVFTRVQLEEQVWPDMVVGYDALTKSIGKLRDALGDTDKPPVYIQTIPKKGYRLIAPVSAKLNEPDSDAPPRIPVAPRARKSLTAVGIVVVMLVVTVALVVLYMARENSAAPEAARDAKTKPYLLVLPFKNLNVDPQQDYFSQGITDDLITDLSGYSGIEVISSRIAFQYRGSDVDIKKIVDELGVRFIVEGSIRRSTQQLRINVQMIDTRYGTNVWAHQYNQPVTSLFDIQDEVRKSIVSALSVKLSEADRKREQKRYTGSYQAYDAFLHGQNSLIKRASTEDNFQARKHFEQAIAIDPGFVRAYAALAMANADAYRHDWAVDPEGTARIALEQARYALELDPESRHATLSAGYVHFFVGRNHKLAAEMAERTLKLDPNSSDANMLLAAIYVHANEYEKAEAYVESSMRLNPNHPSIYYGIGALANLLKGDYENARVLYEHSLAVNPERLMGKIYMVVTLVRMNNLKDARWYAEEIKISEPEFDARKWADKQPYKDKKIVQKLGDDLSNAGL